MTQPNGIGSEPIESKTADRSGLSEDQFALGLTTASSGSVQSLYFGICVAWAMRVIFMIAGIVLLSEFLGSRDDSIPLTELVLLASAAFAIGSLIGFLTNRVIVSCLDWISILETERDRAPSGQAGDSNNASNGIGKGAPR